MNIGAILAAAQDEHSPQINLRLQDRKPARANGDAMTRRRILLALAIWAGSGMVCLLGGRAHADVSVTTIKEWIRVHITTAPMCELWWLLLEKQRPKRWQGRLGCLSGKSKMRGDVSRPLVTHPISRRADSQIHRSQKAKKNTCTPEATLNQ